MLTVFKKKKKSGSITGSSLYQEESTRSGEYDWIFEQENKVSLFTPSAPPVYKEKTVKFHVRTSIRLTTSLVVTNQDVLCHILEKIIQSYNGSYKFKDIHLDNLILVGTHMKMKNEKTDVYEYSGIWDDNILYEIGDRELDPGGNKYHSRGRFKIKNHNVIYVFESELSETNRSGMPYQEIYNIPMSNGQLPPILNWIKTELGI
ncbi:matrix [Bangoran virus]|uniref:matrix n=1 Tax=Bangoran virus TaxID=864693 RepID=UPI002481DBF6|nr:matrix [Bangoran virus]UAX43324.1 matrix [Bangoran virus]